MEEAEAARLEAADPVSSLRDEFAIPPWPGGRFPDWAYLAGNSLGLMPLSARGAVETELGGWERLGVEGWTEGAEPWLEYAGGLRESIGRLLGASANEIAVMSTLTVNLHLLMASFYRPSHGRHRILIEDAAFPSDSYAVQSQALLRGLDPAEAVVRLSPREGRATLRTEDVVAAVERAGGSLALVLLPGVNYLTGQAFDVARITEAAHAVGAVAGWDLAHAIGNVPVRLHDAGADFAVWCHYKYVNAGPGAPGGLFVHERHWRDRTLPRLAGWWGTEPGHRFRMEPDFVPHSGAEGWAVSTPPVLALAPLRASLRQFDRVGLDELRERSMRMTGYLEQLLDEVSLTRRLHLMSPRDPSERGCQLSIATEDARDRAARLRREHGVVCDFREPDVLRLAPAPLYSTYHDCWRAAAALLDVLEPR
jgi:kynureninase